MDAGTQSTGIAGGVGRHLRLRRVFLRALVLSLGACALVAVLVLLVGEFNEFSSRVLLTLGALAVHSGIAMACAHSLERRRWPTLSTIGLGAFGLNLALFLGCVWWPGGLSGERVLRATGTTGALLGAYLIAIPGADFLERRLWTQVAAASGTACAVGLLMCLVCIWAERADTVAFGKATLIANIAAVACAHTCLLVRVPGGGMISGLLVGTIVCLWLLGAAGSLMIVYEPQEELWFRAAGALGVLAASGSLALLILAKLRQVGRAEQIQTATARVELRCPRCTVALVVGSGAARCVACGLQFRIDIEEPRCVKCDYLLWQLPERRCPECGTPF